MTALLLLKHKVFLAYLFNGNQEINLEKNYLEYMKSPQEDVNRTSSNNIKFQRKFGGNL